jgi:hypothetical protein
MKVVRAATLLVLLAPIVAACGPFGSDIDPGRLPDTLDLDRLAGMEVPGTPHCRFENTTRTFLGAAWGGASQNLRFTCRGVSQDGNVGTVDDKSSRAAPEELLCGREHRSTAVDCVVRHERLLVRTSASCGPGADCVGDDERSAETEARAMMPRIIELLEPLPEGATPASGIDPTALPPTVDLDRLAGQPILGEGFEACAFDDDPIDDPPTATIGLRCGSFATGVVAIGDGAVEAIPNRVPGAADDVVVCWRGARQSDCYMRHGMVQLSSTVDCPGGCDDGATPSALIALVAQLLAKLP